MCLIFCVKSLKKQHMLKKQEAPVKRVHFSNFDARRRGPRGARLVLMQIDATTTTLCEQGL